MAAEPVQGRGGKERGAFKLRTHSGPSAEHLSCSLPPGSGRNTVPTFYFYPQVNNTSQDIKNKHMQYYSSDLKVDHRYIYSGIYSSAQ